MENQFSFKDFTDVRLRAIETLQIGDRRIDVGETIAKFDRIQIAGLGDVREVVRARGGFGNRTHVVWDTLKEQKLQFAQGVFSKTHFALLTNTKLVNIVQDEVITVPITEELESDIYYSVYLKEIPYPRNTPSAIFVYDKATGEKVAFSQMRQTPKQISIGTQYQTVIVDYQYAYTGGGSLYQFGVNLYNHFVSLEGFTNMKDDRTGAIVTGLFKVPKLKLLNNLDLHLGAQANPVVASFGGICIPEGERYNSYCSELYILKDDVKSDM